MPTLEDMSDELDMPVPPKIIRAPPEAPPSEEAGLRQNEQQMLDAPNTLFQHE